MNFTNPLPGNDVVSLHPLELRHVPGNDVVYLCPAAQSHVTALNTAQKMASTVFSLVTLTL